MEDTKNNKNAQTNEAEMLESLQRSGYILESEIAKKFYDLEFFVETNQVVKDPFTGKSREIDIIAEKSYFDEEVRDMQAYVKIHFICEVKNNLYPVVLLTPYLFSPNGDITGGLKLGQTGEGFRDGLDINHFNNLFFPDNSYEHGGVFTQYCSFQRKKENSELMALHPEEFYSGLSKVSQCCEEYVEAWGEYEQDQCESEIRDFSHRNFLFLPIIFIKDDLLELSVDSEGANLFRKVPFSRLMFTYHHKDEPKTALVYFVTLSGFDSFVKKMLAAEKEARNFMISGLKSRVR